MVERGEVWWYEEPDRRRRPYLILTRDQAIPLLNQLLGVPTTRTIRGIPTEVPLDREDGMPAPCVLSADNATLVRRALLTERITKLSPGKMRAACEALRAATSC